MAPELLQALRHDARLAGLHPAPLQAFSMAATFAGVTGHPDVLQAFTAAATSDAFAPQLAFLHAFAIFAALAGDTLHPAVWQAFTTAPVLQVFPAQVVAALATGIIDNMITRLAARLTSVIHLFLRKVFIALPPLV